MIALIGLALQLNSAASPGTQSETAAQGQQGGQRDDRQHHDVDKIHVRALR